MASFVLRTGQKIPALGFGTWQSPVGQVGQAVKVALDVGYRHIDCAHVYGNEAEIGELAFGPTFSGGKLKREDIFVTSKLWNTDHASQDVLPACQLTLKNLKLTYLDLYLIHWPVSLRKGHNWPTKEEDYLDVPIEETWAAMEKLVEAGLVRAIGVSNFSIKKLKRVLAVAKIRPAVNQVELSPYLAQNDLLEYCKAEGILLTAYSPLGSPARPSKKDTDPVLLEDPVVAFVAKKHTKSPAQVVLKWAIQRGTSVVPKSVTPERIRSNFEVEDFVLDAEDMAAINKLDRHLRMIDASFFVRAGSTVKQFWDE